MNSFYYYDPSENYLESKVSLPVHSNEFKIGSRKKGKLGNFLQIDLLGDRPQSLSVLTDHPRLEWIVDQLYSTPFSLDKKRTLAQLSNIFSAVNLNGSKNFLAGASYAVLFGSFPSFYQEGSSYLDRKKYYLKKTIRSNLEKAKYISNLDPQLNWDAITVLKKQNTFAREKGFLFILNTFSLFIVDFNSDLIQIDL